MLDPVLARLLAQAGETALGRALQYDPGTKAALTGLEGRLIAFEFTQPRFDLYFTVIDGLPRLLTYTEQIPECRLRGSAAAIASLTWEERSTLANSGVELIGSPQLLAQLKQLLGNIDLDWEEPLNALLGDVTGHALAQGLRQMGHKVRRSTGKLPGYVAEYLTEEARHIVSDRELQPFFRAVDELRADTDRLQARLAELDRLINFKA